MLGCHLEKCWRDKGMPNNATFATIYAKLLSIVCLILLGGDIMRAQQCVWICWSALSAGERIDKSINVMVPPQRQQSNNLLRSNCMSLRPRPSIDHRLGKGGGIEQWLAATPFSLLLSFCSCVLYIYLWSMMPWHSCFINKYTSNSLKILQFCPTTWSSNNVC